jgi:mRNA interferase MazF
VELVSYLRRDEVWLIALDPWQGSEIKKTRPGLVVSPHQMNDSLQTTLVATMTTTLRNYPTRVNMVFRGKAGQVALDQLRAIDRQRLVRRLGAVTSRAAHEVSSVLVEMFVR